MNAKTKSRTALFISPDLLFAGKIQAAAAPLGMDVLPATQPADILRAFAEKSVCIVLVDLNVSSPSVSEIMELLPGVSKPAVVAFGPHVNTARLEEARAAGCDRVLPRSRFATELPDLLRSAVEGG